MFNGRENLKNSSIKLLRFHFSRELNIYNFHRITLMHLGSRGQGQVQTGDSSFQPIPCETVFFFTLSLCLGWKILFIIVLE